MQHRQLGNSSLKFSVIGLGTWAIGGSNWKYGWGHQDEREAIDGITHAVECGVNWIDTAPIYGSGNSEILVGRALKEIPVEQRPFVATKHGRIMQEDGTPRGDLTPENVRRECALSLERLGVEHIDLYQIHWPDPDSGIEAAWETMVKLKEEGLVREIGVSNCNVSQLERLQKIHPIASLQPHYNMFSREFEEQLLPYCQANKIGVVAYSPMCKGLLTGKFTAERAAALTEEDHRSRDAQFLEPRLSVHLDLVEKLKPLAASAGHDVVQLAICWVLRDATVTSAIIGTRKPEQIQQTAQAGDWNLDSTLVEEIDSLLKVHDTQLEELEAKS
ncbi:aldo/keto reductase [Adhaeretor mobilis]|uniref:General stress protein 69 n=1 Tax=Adhaeretor mobilis TaxID=1930276 RepID=A0A517MZI5_9BACT|nr:aldo/keto reductase [Adhaeretor mobilis]QDT00306.1 General stress protein 69 [Adhaeretor mobilis]